MTWSDRLEREHDNVRAALRWALDCGELRVGLRLAAALRRFWWRRDYLSEGRRWLAELLARAEPHSALRNTPEWATALGAAGYLAWAQADYEAARAHYRAAIERWVELGEPRGLAAAQGFMGTTLSWQGEQRTARPLLEQSLTGWRRIEHAVGTGNALFQLGIVALFERRFADADDLLSQALSLHRQVHSVHDVAYDMTMLGFAAVQRGELAAARRYLAEARDLMVGLDDHWGILVLLECTSALAAAEGDAVRALRLVGVASALRDRTGVPLPRAHRESFEPWFLAAQRVLPATEAEAATSSGRALLTGQAMRGTTARLARRRRSAGCRGQAAAGCAQPSGAGNCYLCGSGLDQPADRRHADRLEADCGKPRQPHRRQAGGEDACSGRGVGYATRSVGASPPH